MYNSANGDEEEDELSEDSEIMEMPTIPTTLLPVVRLRVSSSSPSLLLPSSPPFKAASTQVNPKLKAKVEFEEPIDLNSESKVEPGKPEF